MIELCIMGLDDANFVSPNFIKSHITKHLNIKHCFGIDNLSLMLSLALNLSHSHST